MKNSHCAYKVLKPYCTLTLCSYDTDLRVMAVPTDNGITAAQVSSLVFLGSMIKRTY